MVRTSNSTLQNKNENKKKKERRKKSMQSPMKKINKAAGMRWKFLSLKHKIEINKLIKSTFTRCIIVGSC